MSLADDITDDFLDLWEEVGSLVVIGKATLKAFLTPSESSLELDLGGFETRLSLEVRVLRAHLKVFPKIGEILDFDGLEYRISSITSKQGSPILTLQCQEK